MKVSFNSDAIFDQNAGSVGGLQQWRVAPVCQERDVAWRGMIDARNARDFHVPVAFQMATQLFCDFFELHGSPPSRSNVQIVSLAQAQA